MSPDPTADLTADELLAERLVDEALEGMALPARLRKIIRVTMIGELLTTPEGRAQLRRASPDPTVASSSEVDKAGLEGALGARIAPARRGGGRP